MRIGLFGGTFNPIHLGHLRAAQEVREAFALDTIYLIPSAQPPHKFAESLARAEDRLEMTRLAVAGHKGFRVSDVELKRPGPSYTIDTISHFKTLFPTAIVLYLIVGMDAFLEIDTWKSFRDLFQTVPIVVMSRPGMGTNDTFSYRKKLEEYLKNKISGNYRFSPDKSCFLHDQKKPVYFFNVTLMDISSTQIRQLRKENRSLTFLVPDIVEKFINTKGLYV
jgi:nicotinate-nucleotide adenylyltransferase